MKSNVSQLNNDDLNGLTKLKLFDVSYNPITRLTRDFFKGHSSIETISFYDCKLSVIEAGALDPLVNLKEGHFQYNHCIDYRGDAEGLIPELKRKIKRRCETDNGESDESNEYLHVPEVNPDYPEYGGDYITFETTESARHKIQHKAMEIAEKIAERESFSSKHIILIVMLLTIAVICLTIYVYKKDVFTRYNWH